MKNSKFYIFTSFLVVALIAVTLWPTFYTPPKVSIVVSAADVLQTVTIRLPGAGLTLPLIEFFENLFIEAEPTIEEELIQVTFMIQAEPEYRAGGNLAIRAQLVLDAGLEVIEADVMLDTEGFVAYEVELPPGIYDIGINGISHLTKIIYDVELIESGLTHDLDYTINGTFKLVGGDIFDDNSIISSDIAQTLRDYRKTTSIGVPFPSDVNGDLIVNSLDIAIVLQNYRRTGDQWI